MKKVCTTLHFFLVLVCGPVQLVHVMRHIEILGEILAVLLIFATGILLLAL
jgi:hypothetical protein